MTAVRRRVVAVVGDGSSTSAAEAIAEELGRGLIELGFRLVTGGLGGVMEAASRGAQSAPSHRDGDVIGILPSLDVSTANPFVDVAVPTGLGIARNALVVSTADAVIAVGGGSGTLSEMAMAWQLGKPVIGVLVPGWSELLADRAIDGKRSDRVESAPSAAAALAIVARRLGEAGA